jgi:hypothetical protein
MALAVVVEGIDFSVREWDPVDRLTVAAERNMSRAGKLKYRLKSLVAVLVLIEIVSQVKNIVDRVLVHGY